MPYKSDAQRRFFHAAEDRGDISPKVVDEFDKASKGKKLPEHVKMNDGGVPENKDEKTITQSAENQPKEGDAFTEGIKEGVNHDSDAVRSYLSSKFHQLLNPEEHTKMAEGGYPHVTFLENVSTPEMRKTVHLEDPSGAHGKKIAAGHAENYAEGGYPHVTFLENETPEKVQETVHLEPKKPMPTTTTETGEKENPPHAMADGGAIHKAEGRDKEPAKPADVNMSHEEKLKSIYQAMGIKKYADGGPVLPQTDPGAGVPSASDPTFWNQVKAALAKVGAPMAAPVNAVSGMAEKVAPVAAQAAPAAVSALNTLTGASLPVPAAPAPKTQDLGAPTPLAAALPPAQAPATPPIVPLAAKPAGAGTPSELKNLFNQDTSKLTEGFNPEDRQKLAAQTQEGQRGLGSMIAEAVSGLGDALAAKGGREQHSLKDIFSMQKLQRDEALANFDKARQDRLEKLDLQTKMGMNAIQKLAAQDAYGVDEHLNKQLGAPPGTLHKDLPLYFQMKTAEVGQAEKDADLYMKAHAQAANEVEGALKNAGMFNIKPSPAQIQASGAKLADQYYNRAKGNVAFQPSDGQKPIWIPAKNAATAKQRDPNGQIIP